jgi:hypothetical protein
MKNTEIYVQALSIIGSYPKSGSGKPYITMNNGSKIYFDVFIHKYGIIGNQSAYTPEDVIRRIRLVEFFEYILHSFPMTYQERTWNFIIETYFYKMVISKHFNTKNRWRYVVISFYAK